MVPSPSPVEIAPGVVFGGDLPVCVAGTCAIEGREMTLRAAVAVAAAASEAGLPAVFKASFDKANRTSVGGFRGLGIRDGLEILAEVRAQTGLPVLTDVHQPEQAQLAAEVADVLQVPAFLCRQTDLLAAVAATGKPVNVKKGQFLAPGDMRHVIGKLRAHGARDVLLTERGTSFGYRELIVDMRSLPILRALGCPVVFDATHSVQRPSADGDRSGGDRQMVPTLLRAAVAAGVDGVFVEVHEDPDRALSDGPNSLPLHALAPLLEQVRQLHELVRSLPSTDLSRTPPGG